MSETGSALPPPSPPDPRSQRWEAIWPTLAVLGLGIAVVTTVLWWGERNELNSTTSNIDAGPDLVVELDSVRRELGEARTSLAEAEAEIARLTEANERLVADPSAAPAEGDREGDDVDGVGDDGRAPTEDASDDDGGGDEETVLSGAGEPAPGGGDTNGSSAANGLSNLTPLEIGTQLGGLYRENVLGGGQRRCLGETVSGALGQELDEIFTASDPGSDARLVDALLDAAPECGIDSSALFG